jgi:hypothetical protein
MFDDLVTTKPDGPKSMDMDMDETIEEALKVRNYTAALLIDIESIMQEMDAKLTAITGNCHFCGKNDGNGHSEKCEYRVATIRLALEIDYLI